MEAIERTYLHNDLVTLTFLVGVVLLFIMKLYKPQRLLGYSIAFFTQGFIEKRAEDNPSFFSPFHGVLFLFSVVTLSLFFFLLPVLKIEETPLNFFLVFGFVLAYFFVYFFINYFISAVLGIKEQLQYFLFSKSGYLYSLCLWLFPTLIIYRYGLKSVNFLIFIASILFIFRAFLILKNNKKLIFSQLFYFILYFCTLELAPLLILYKTTTV